MKILYLDIAAFFANKDMLDALDNYTDDSGNKLEIIRYPYTYEESRVRNDSEFEADFLREIKKLVPDFVFSFNFLPVVSKVCNVDGVPYVSWIYDNPELFLYSYQIINPCNIVLLFDSKQYEEFWRGGIKTVRYLPLAASTKRLDKMIPDKETIKRFECDISFVGSLYTERRQYYKEIEDKLDKYTLGYLEGLMRAQMKVSGVNFIEECLRKEIVENIAKVTPIHTPSDSAETIEHLYSNYVINRQITVTERKELLTEIGKRFALRLYTYSQNKDFAPEGIINMGPADYFNDMPYIFKLSKINLNITLRSITNGIPLRAYDILGAGGFLLSNYQTDLIRHFIPEEDYVYYEDSLDLINKIDYYLKHEDERKSIAQNAHDKVMKEHTFDVRVGQIIEMVRGGGSPFLQ